MPRKSGSSNGRFYVGDSPKKCDSRAMAVAFAQYLAKDAPIGAKFHVHELGVQGILVRVTKAPDAIITERVR